MQERLLRVLETYHDLAKAKQEVLDQEDQDEELERIQSAIGVLEQTNAKQRAQSSETQERIFSLQEKKLEIMNRLKRKLNALDDPEQAVESEKGDYHVTTDTRGRLFSKGEEITKGTLLTDPEWGIHHKFDSRIPRKLQKKYFIEEAKYDLRRLLDEQIIEDMLGSKYTEEGARKSYGAFQELRGQEETVAGWVAERLVKSFIKRIAIDFDLDIELMDVDVYEDVKHKIDFIIRRKSHVRGVDTELDRTPGKTGVQLTISESQKRLKGKERQIKRVKNQREKDDELAVNDIVLVSIPMGDVLEMYQAWESHKRKPGGPVRYWDAMDQEIVFRNVLKDVMTNAEIEAQWHLVNTHSRKKAA